MNNIRHVEKIESTHFQNHHNNLSDGSKAKDNTHKVKNFQIFLDTATTELKNGKTSYH